MDGPARRHVGAGLSLNSWSVLVTSKRKYIHGIYFQKSTEQTR